MNLETNIDTPIKITVGYILKVLKHKRKIAFYKNEFNAIKHGDYKEFMRLIPSSIPFIVVYNNGNLKANLNNQNYDLDFEGLIKSQNALAKFYTNSVNHYGKINDLDISDEIYFKMVEFEIAIRMHANNNNLLFKNTRIDLIDVINILGAFLKLSQSEINQIQEGRIFLNMVKHNKGKFSSWQIGINEFNKAFLILKKYKILIN